MNETKQNKVAVAVSGGADSLYAMISLKEQNYDLIALHARLLAPASLELEANETRKNNELALIATCEALNIPLHFIDLYDEFEKKVIAPFSLAWNKGQTPNPCALCNAQIKFGLLQDQAFKLGASSLATGHYARLVQLDSANHIIVAAQDQSKDQSYFLSLVPAEKLKSAIFPLGNMLKADVKLWLAEHGYAVPIPKESQEICFIENDDYKAFLLKRQTKLSGAGDITFIGTDKKLGTHRGLWQYTEGQRRGLGVAYSEPLYVLAKDLKKNRLIVGTKAELNSSFVSAGAINLLLEPQKVLEILQTQPVWVKTRYRQKAVPAKVELQNNKLAISFLEPQDPSAPGQVAAVYASLPKSLPEQLKTEPELNKSAEHSLYLIAAGIIE